ncbi:MAG: hypothetical protein JSR76_04375 [Verrucomicrobia bacterium]|nr:hypothetical protein [Verrucomicrobiota bacterium]
MDVVSPRGVREEFYEMEEMQERGKPAPELCEISEVARRALVVGAEEQGRAFLGAQLACQLEEIGKRSEIQDVEKAVRGLWEKAAFLERLHLDTEESRGRAVLEESECEERALLVQQQVKEELWGLAQEEIRGDELIGRVCFKVCEAWDRALLVDRSVKEATWGSEQKEVRGDECVGREFLSSCEASNRDAIKRTQIKEQVCLLVNQERDKRNSISSEMRLHRKEILHRWAMGLVAMLERPCTVRRRIDFHGANLLRWGGGRANVLFGPRKPGALLPIDGNIRR